MYESPSGVVYVLSVDRWESPALAAEMQRVLSYPRQVAFAWGAYTFAVTGHAPADRQPSIGELRREATHLLSHVQTPAGSELGGNCVARFVA